MTFLTKEMLENSQLRFPERIKDQCGSTLEDKPIKTTIKQRRINKCQSYEPNKLLEQAIEENYTDVVLRLINSGQVNINKLNENGYAPIHKAAFEDKVNMVCVLLDCGAFIDQRDISGLTALEIAVTQGCFESAKILTDRGADQKCIMNGIHL